MILSPADILQTLPLSDENLYLLTEIFDVIPLQIAVKSLLPDTYGAFLIWNRECEVELGITNDEALGCTERDLFPLEQALFFEEKDREVEFSGSVIQTAREPVTCRNRGLRFRRTIRTPIFDSEENLLALLQVSTDLPEQELQADAAAAKNSDVRTHLDALTALTHSLEGTPLSAAQRDCLAALQKHSTDLAALLPGVSEQQHPGTNPGPLDLMKALSAIIQTVHIPASEKDLTLRLITYGEVPETLVCDGEQLRRVMEELLRDAVHRTEQGSVGIEVESESDESQTACTVTIRVRDTARILPGENRNARCLCEQAGWTMSVDTSPDAGSVVSLGLDLTCPRNGSAVHQPAETPQSNGSKQMLIVDDNTLNRRLIRIQLQHLGYDADEATSGPEAVQLAALNTYDWIFMDLEMPGMDGFEATRLIQASANGSVPRFVALITHGVPDHRTRSLHSGMHAFLDKPVRQGDLAQILTDTPAPLSAGTPQEPCASAGKD